MCQPGFSAERARGHPEAEFLSLFIVPGETPIHSGARRPAAEPCAWGDRSPHSLRGDVLRPSKQNAFLSREVFQKLFAKVILKPPLVSSALWLRNKSSFFPLPSALPGAEPVPRGRGRRALGRRHPEARTGVPTALEAEHFPIPRASP